MGWGAAQPVVIYGFDLAHEDSLFDYDYMWKNFPTIQMYATEVSKGFYCEALYGIECSFNQDTGLAYISEGKKKEVNKLFNKYIDHLRSTLSRDKFERAMNCITLGFHRAVTGDMESCREINYITLTANEDKEKVEESEEESEEEMDDDDDAFEAEGEAVEVHDDEDEDNGISATAVEATDAAQVIQAAENNEAH